MNDEKRFHIEYPLVLFRFCFLPLPMYHCRWTICPRGYLSGSNYIWMTRKGFTSNTPWYFLDFAFYHYPCTTAGGQLVPEGTCRVVIIYEWREKVSHRIPLGTFSILLTKYWRRGGGSFTNSRFCIGTLLKTTFTVADREPLPLFTPKHMLR